MRHVEAQTSLRMTGDLMSKLFIPAPLSAHRTVLAACLFATSLAAPTDATTANKETANIFSMIISSLV
jgi:hypothetical protein